MILELACALGRVRWHVAAVGNEVDLHNTHWHGNTLLWENHNADQCAPTPFPVVTLIERLYAQA